MDDADRASEQELRLAEARARQAVARVTRPSPGKFCVVCGEEIPMARRLAMPTARTCAPCQSELEEYRGG